MSDTPRTDELRDKLARLGWNPHKDKPVADLFVEMEKLERELAEARKQRDTLMNALEAVVEVARRNLSRPHPTVERFYTEALAAVKKELK